jgi:hypothetical protein
MAAQHKIVWVCIEDVNWGTEMEQQLDRWAKDGWSPILSNMTRKFMVITLRKLPLDE